MYCLFVVLESRCYIVWCQRCIADQTILEPAWRLQSPGASPAATIFYTKGGLTIISTTYMS